VRKINEAGLDLIKSFEGLRLHAYLDGGGVPTIGYGHIKGVRMGQIISDEQATEFLREDLHEAETGVDKRVPTDISENQFAACVSLAFNIGIGAFGGSTLVRRLSAGDERGAADQFLKWNKDNGKVVAGLTRRRQAERALFLTPDEDEADTEPLTEPMPAVETPKETTSEKVITTTTTATETPTATVEKKSIISKVIDSEQLPKIIASEGVGQLATKAITGLTAASTVSTAGAAESSNPWPWIILAIVCVSLAAGVVIFLMKHKSDKQKEAARINSDKDRTDVVFEKK
jgi:lysozyme